MNSGKESHDDGQWSRERVLAFVLLAATALALYLCYLLARPFLPALIWALALAVVAHPLHEWIARRVARPNPAAALAVLVVAVIIVAPTLLVLQQASREIAASVDRFKDNGDASNWLGKLERIPNLGRMVKWLEGRFDFAAAKDNAVGELASSASSVVKGSMKFAVQLLITFFILFYFFRDRRPALEALRKVLPLSHAEAGELFKDVDDTIFATIYGTLLVGLVQGTLGGLMFWGLGLSAPLLWGIAMALLATVPILGAFVIWIPAAIYLALDGHWMKAVILTVWGTVVIGLLDNLLYPVFVGQRLRLHTLPVFISILGGLVLFGASGLILGPMTLAITLALLKVWQRRTAGGGTVEQGIHESRIGAR